LVAYKMQNPAMPDTPPTLREAIHMVASLGGFLGRKGDGEPGTQTSWLGLQRLDDLAAMWILMSNETSHIRPILLCPEARIMGKDEFRERGVRGD